jgi:hypothetical protein
MTLGECPPDYLHRLLDLPDLSPWLRRAIEEHLGVDRPVDPDPDPDPTHASVALPRVTWEWQDAMRREYAGNPAALAVIDRGLIHLQRLCTRFTHRPWTDHG